MAPGLVFEAALWCEGGQTRPSVSRNSMHGYEMLLRQLKTLLPLTHSGIDDGYNGPRLREHATSVRSPRVTQHQWTKMNRTNEEIQNAKIIMCDQRPPSPLVPKSSWANGPNFSGARIINHASTALVLRHLPPSQKRHNVRLADVAAEPELLGSLVLLAGAIDQLFDRFGLENVS
ncbi:hypothetical protein PpBr36_08455 [Pyricularia pennisetigena]|uniref:hypothetical protein n=1 Tax=Pyricularia pennisetigena TaxID=1578925 RepID=UPI001152716D|nr:hypothetical protein PpBr36_08455 [Pyricularia pennisetigena]TLS24408.1 hypothetical protein PpBr36_08455 [Pyricularia pennisetigena]